MAKYFATSFASEKVVSARYRPRTRSAVMAKAQPVTHAGLISPRGIRVDVVDTDQ